MLTTLLNNPVLLFLVVAAFGSALGALRLGAFSLGSIAVLLVGLLLGHLGHTLPDVLMNLGLALFVYAVGLQSGPGFFATFRREGLVLGAVALAMALSGALVSWSVGGLLGLEQELRLGVFTGSLNSALAFASLAETVSGPQLTLGFSIAFPLALVGMILFVRFIPGMLHASPAAETAAHTRRLAELHPAPETRFYRVTNPACDGHTLRELDLPDLTGAVIATIRSGDAVITPDAEHRLRLHDVVKVVGPREAHARIRIALGEETREVIRRTRHVKVRRIVVTQKEVVGRTLAQLDVHGRFGATVTRIRRAGLSLTPTASTVLRFGDKLTVVVEKSQAKPVRRLLGDDLRAYRRTNLLPALIAMLVGGVVGSVPLWLPGGLRLQLGLAGGVFLVGLIVGRLGRVGPVLFTLSGESLADLRNFGGLLFMAALGTRTGQSLGGVALADGLLVLLALLSIGATLTVGLLLSRRVLHHDLVDNVGLVSGGVSHTMALEEGNRVLGNEDASTTYAAIYPAGLVASILVAQLWLRLL